MKGKVVSLKVILTMLFALIASFCFAFGALSKSGISDEVNASYSKVTLGTDGVDGTCGKQEYSALVDGDIILSVEKVAVNSIEDNNGIPNALTSANGTFLANYDESATNETYTFNNISNGSSNKTVIEDGKFVKLENVFKNEKFSYESNNSLQEAVLVSFGSYVYNSTNETVKIATNDLVANSTKDDSVHAGISFLEVIAKKNNQTIELPDIRNIQLKTGGLYFDFAYLITQKEDNSNEGFYQFDFRYIVNGEEKTAYFEFYMVNNSSYTDQINPEGKNYGYNAYPTLGWVDDGTNFEHSTDTDGYVKYNLGSHGIGETDISYPTLTYDYTRYEISYVHNTNNKNTTYSFTTDLISQPAKLIATITSSGVTSTKEYYLADHLAEETSLVTIVLTEAGTYTIEGKYLYKGYNSAVAPDMGFGTINKKLSIHGMSAYYSKTDYSGAKLKYFEVAKTKGNNIDVVIPNGYEKTEDISSLKDQKLGFVYSFVESTQREGNVILSNTIDSLLNAKLKHAKNATSYKSDYEFLTTNINNIKTDIDSVKDNINNVLGENGENITYAQTNQGSIWFEGNDTYNNSFYFYDSTPIDFEVIKKTTNIDGKGTATTTDDEYGLPLSNTTSFKTKGYYLVFVKVDLKADYWQIFAFQYTSSSVDISVEAIDDKNTSDPADDNYEIVSNGKYTNKKVRISWKKPGIFDRAITPYYYSESANIDKDALLTKTKHELETFEDGEYFRAYLGENVSNNTFKKYLIRLESEGESATHKMFTVDKQNISGIQAWLVEEMNSGNSTYYTFATDVNSNKIRIDHSITDGIATLTWNNKESGAETFAEYSYIPFSVTSTNDMTSFTGNNGKEWMTTNYQLGEKIIKGTDLFKYSGAIVGSDGILNNQGIYLIKIWDSAGNSCDYMFVIDRTNNFFKVEDNYLSNETIIFGDDVSYSIGDYKVFKLNFSTEENSLVLNNYIKAAAEKSLSQVEGYYKGATTNANTLSNIFQKYANDYYLTVGNSGVVGYDGGDKDSSIQGLSGQLNYSSLSTDTYYTRTLYAYGINHTILNEADKKEGSYVNVEINKDNARGYVYYSNNEIDSNKIPLDGLNKNNMFKLKTGTDLFDASENKIDNGLKSAQATSANHVVFTWKMGTGNFEVGKVYYSFYALDPKDYKDNELYYYSLVENVSVYDNGSWEVANAGTTSENGYVIFNGTSNSKAGLYIITREYKGADLSDDVKLKNYYFIIDRNGIIDVSAEIGKNIKLELMEGEVSFNEFSTQTNNRPSFSYNEDNISQANYNIYLTTSKIPATLSIPTGKYYIDSTKTSSKYEAGQLNVSVYFNDSENQLGNISGVGDKYKGGIVKIFESKNEDFDNDIFNIDIYEYLATVNLNLRDRMTISNQNRNWLFLPGTYIIRITDNVVNGTGSKLCHEKYIGLEISNEHQNPLIGSFTGSSKDDNMGEITLNNIGDNYSSTVSQEFLKVVLPKYSIDETRTAQVDPSYIVVKQYYGENATGKNYIDHRYAVGIDGISLTENREGYVSINADGSVNVWLDTKLRKNGEIDYNNINVPLYYEITIRYRLNKFDQTDNFEKYKDCYVYYVGSEKNYYYETTFTIRIDREAPKTNIATLNNNDSLVGDYNSEFGTDEMIETGIHHPGSDLYFTKQYAKYYQEKKVSGNDNAGFIYAYQVFSNTVYSLDDISKIYYKKINTLSEATLTLPFINSGYTEVKMSDIKEGKYSSLGLPESGYYEIVEQDGAGNATQYVIHYNPNLTDSDVKISVKVKQASNGDEDTTYITLKNPNHLYIYEIDSNGEEVKHLNENFFKVEVKKIDGTSVFTELTTATTDFEKLTENIVEALNRDFGTYTLTITTRSTSGTTNIYLYNVENLIRIDVEELVEKRDEKYYIVLNKANRTIEQDGNTLMFFAKEIRVNGESYVAENVNGLIVYKRNGVSSTISEIECAESASYYIEMIDVIGNKSTYRFNTSGQDFIVVDFAEFGEDGGENFYKSTEGTNIVYYGFTTATFKFDKTIYETKIFKKENQDFIVKNIIAVEDGNYKKYTLTPTFNESTYQGGLDEYKIELYFGDDLETTYYISIDTRLSEVALRDYATGEQKDIFKVLNNTFYNNSDVKADNTDSGIMNLQWSEIAENNYFDYEFTLYELLKEKDENGNDNYKITTLTGKTNHVIATGADSSGKYVFEITVFGKNGNKLGNRIYAFEVQEVSNQIYYVRDESGVAIKANSDFKLEDITDYESAIQDKFGKVEGEYIIKTGIKFPLYVTNQDLEIIVAVANVEKMFEVIEETADYKFTIYKISKTNSYDIFIGILKVSEVKNLVKDVQVSVGDSTLLDVDNETSFVAAGDKDTSVLIKATEDSLVTDSSNSLLKKNKIMIDVSYGNVSVSTEEFEHAYEVLGNGRYSFVFKDLAGNVHMFNNQSQKLDVNVLREVVVTLNDQAPIENGYYNDEVKLAIYESSKYVTGSVQIKATRNGERYEYKGYNPYIFSDYGTYIVKISAKYNNDGKEIDVNKTVTFTILNVNEARRSINLTNLAQYKITSVKNQLGVDVTDTFLNIANSKNSGYHISYEDILANSKDLKITTGKQTFTIKYEVEDKIYPTREVEFGFTLNNEQPTILCSMDKGDSTTKDFTITFNAAVIYEQVGESYIYVNDIMVAHINEDSANVEQKYKVSYKNHGDGDYYVKLVSTSDVVLDSFKVTIKEPLNFWAIVVIIVVVGVVSTVVVTIIVLRRKMRIR